MRRKFLALLFLLPAISIAQVSDDFSDGDFTNNPAWVGDVASWQVVGGQLNSNNAVLNSSFYLSTVSTLATATQWEIWVNFKQATSGANYMDIYLTSDIQDLNGAGNGYFVRIGGTPDEISLYKKAAGSSTKIIDGTDGRSQVNSTDNFFKIKVTCTAASLWTLMDDNTGAGTTFVTEGTVTDASFTTSSYFGISVTQSTASFFNKHYFDSVSVGNIVVDLTPPIINSVNPTATQLDVTFSEPVEQTIAETATNYSVNNGIGNPVTASRDAFNFSLVHLTFSTPFTSGLQNTLTVNNIQDLNSNTIAANSTINFTYNAPVSPLPFDVVINEFLADPDPVVGLPNSEFVEIYNRSNKNFNLSGWSFSDASSSITFGNQNLAPGSYLILCGSSSLAAYSVFGPAYGFSSFPSLNNTGGETLTLKDNNGNTIDNVYYDETYYHDSNKSNGGWSIERINPGYTCTNALNWKASTNAAGGTPGTLNSVNGVFVDNVAPQLIRATAPASSTVKLYFSEELDLSAVSSTLNFSIDNGIGNPSSVVFGSDNSILFLTLTNALQQGVVYHVTVSPTIKDCPGNTLLGNNIVKVALAENIVIGDILINEILFNPKTGGSDFVELYNNSTKPLDLIKLNIANTDPANDSIDTFYPAAADNYLFFPGDYVVLTENPDNIIQTYPSNNPKAFLKTPALPSYNDDEGTVVITDLSMTRLDEFHYTDNLQYPLLNDVEGISLERISFSRPTNDGSNWHSASEASGFATPGLTNSQASDSKGDGSEVSVDPELFSPDNDGYHDLLNIHYKFDSPGYTANVTVFDSNGREIKKLIRNELLGTEEGNFSWDGINEDNEKGRVGIYVLYFEAFSLNGDVKKFKKPFVLAVKL